MTDKLMNDVTLEDENADAFAQEDMSQEEQSTVNSKGGQASDEGLDQYEVGSFESNGTMEEEDDSSESSESENPSKSQNEA